MSGISTLVHLSEVSQAIVRIAPQTILDVGLGFGTWGFICRAHLDVANNRYLKKDWQIRIDGIEIFEKYIQKHQRFLYDNIFIGDAYEWVDELSRYDLIILGDVLEHLEKNKGYTLLGKCLEKSNKSVIVNIPLGSGWQRSVTHGNVHESHISRWDEEDFCGLGTEAQIHTYTLLNGLRYGWIHFEISRSRYKELIDKGIGLLDRENYRQAAAVFMDAIDLNPYDPEAYINLATGLINLGDVAKAEHCLERALCIHPMFFEGYKPLAKLYLFQKKEENYLSFSIAEEIP